MRFIVHIKHLEKCLLTEYYESLINIYKFRKKLKQYVKKKRGVAKKKKWGQEREWREKSSKDMFFLIVGGIHILDSQKKRILWRKLIWFDNKTKESRSSKAKKIKGRTISEGANGWLVLNRYIQTK